MDDRASQKAELECIFSRGTLLAKIGVPQREKQVRQHSNATSHYSPSIRVSKHRTVICDRMPVIQDFDHD
jgi:hypothetical protein